MRADPGGFAACDRHDPDYLMVEKVRVAEDIFSLEYAGAYPIKVVADTQASEGVRARKVRIMRMQAEGFATG